MIHNMQMILPSVSQCRLHLYIIEAAPISHLYSKKARILPVYVLCVVYCTANATIIFVSFASIFEKLPALILSH